MNDVQILIQLRRINRRLSLISTRLRRMEIKMSAELDRLVSKVTEAVTVEESAILLIENLATTVAEIQAELAAIGVTNAKLDELATTLETEDTKLTEAIVAHTPVAPTP